VRLEKGGLRLPIPGPGDPVAAMTELRWLVIRADRSCRITMRRPALGTDEVAVLLRLQFPDGWGKVIDTIDVEVPGPVEVMSA
jgi:hypothetical protein